MRGFLPLYGINLESYSGPVVLRYVLWRFNEIPVGSGLRTFPADVLYGGPTSYAATQTPQGQAFVRALQTWAMAYGYVGYPEWIPVAPERFGHRWPHRGWTWEMRRELELPARYSLAGVPPQNFWRRVV